MSACTRQEVLQYIFQPFSIDTALLLLMCVHRRTISTTIFAQLGGETGVSWWWRPPQSTSECK